MSQVPACSARFDRCRVAGLRRRRREEKEAEEEEEEEEEGKKKKKNYNNKLDSVTKSRLSPQITALQNY